MKTRNDHKLLWPIMALPVLIVLLLSVIGGCLR